jgi:3-oxoacyl-[acyl-carrier-protein] synthase-3
MSHTRKVAILGTGYSVPDHIRGNDDPIFDWIKANRPDESGLFGGLHQRRVLAHGGDLVRIMCESAQAALEQAGLAAADVGMLLGSASVSQYYSPNDLALVHRDLGLSSRCRVMPVNTEYTNFLDGMKLADDLVRCGTIENALVVCGNNWTHHMDYREPVGHLASDGAGAAVVGWSSEPQDFHLIDWDNETRTDYFGVLRMAPRRSDVMGPLGEPLFTQQLMKVDDESGTNAIRAFGMQQPPIVIERLLSKHGLTGADVTLISHQSSGRVFDHWRDAIRPAHYVNTILEFGDMVSSSVPVTLARCFDQINTDKLVLMGIGQEMRVTVLLYGRAR